MRPVHMPSGALAFVLLAAASLPAVAQERNPRLVASEPGRFIIPLCQLGPSGRAEDGERELRRGIESPEARDRAEALENAEDILTAAVARGDGGNAAAWYYLARTYLARGDVAGADSAFTKVERMVPDCEIDINQYRQDAWAMLANAGLDLRREGRSEEAMQQFRDATRMFRGLPHVYENMGLLFANGDMYDSAAFYFGKALAVAENDSTLVENRNSSAINRVVTLRRLGRHEEAVQLLDRYLTWNPSDADAQRAKAMSLRQLGRDTEAEAIERELVSRLADTDIDSLGLGDLLELGIAYYNNDEYANAVTMFERAVEQSPWNRDAVYNLTHALTMLVTTADDSAEAARIDEAKRRLAEVGRLLVDIEPLNEDSYRLPARGYQGRHQDSMVVVAHQLMALPVHVEVTQVTLSGSSVRWSATATGRAAVDAAGEPIPAAPVTVVLEFLDGMGQVVGSTEIAIPALEAGTTHELGAEIDAPDATSWRYRRK